MLSPASLAIRLHPHDDVVIARTQLVGGTALIDENVTVAGLIPPGHKVAAHAVRAGAPVRRYNQIIGFASRAIAPGTPWSKYVVHGLTPSASTPGLRTAYQRGQYRMPCST